MLLARATFASLVAVSALAVLAGCGGRTSGTDLTSPSDPTLPDDPPTPPPPVTPPTCQRVACEAGDDSVGSESNCYGADYCYSRTSSCNGTSVVLWCAHRTAQCDGYPVCDGGDTQVKGCPPGPSGTTCYSRTACGTTIQCFHRDSCTSLPTCDPGDKEVVDVATCGKPGVSCYSRSECNFTIWCTPP